MKRCPVCEKTWNDFDLTAYCDVHGVELQSIDPGRCNVFLNRLEDSFRDTNPVRESPFRAVRDEPSLNAEFEDLPDLPDVSGGRSLLTRPAVVGLGLLLIGAIFGASALLFREVNQFYTLVQFPGGAQGLKVGDNVFVLGRQSGQVRDVELLNRSECLVTLEIDGEAAKLLDTETVFYVWSDKFFMGKKCVKTLLGSGIDSRRLESNERVNGARAGPRLWRLILEHELGQIRAEL